MHLHFLMQDFNAALDKLHYAWKSKHLVLLDLRSVVKSPCSTDGLGARNN